MPSRRREAVYLILLAAGFLIPYAQIVPWLADNGLDLGLFRRELFAGAVSSFFGWDVIVAVVALIVVAGLDRTLHRNDRVLVIAGSLLGASVGLPLYLWRRQRRLRVTEPAD